MATMSRRCCPQLEPSRLDERIFLTFLTFLFKEVGEGGGGVGWRNMFYTACKIYIGNSS